MQSPVLNHLLQQNFSGLPAKDFLQQLAAEHPYFSPAQFFLLQQLNESDSTYSEQVAKTALLFNNPHWLQLKLHQVPQLALLKETPVIAMYAENTDNDDDTAQLVTATENTAGLEVETAIVETNETPFAQTLQPDDEEPGNDDDNAVLIPQTENRQPQEITTGATEAAPAAAIEEEPVQYPENADNDDDNALLVTEEKTPEGMPEVKINLAASLKAAENENALSFEPMHLVDYFASQGIKLSEEVQTADKLGKQLKSFTQWLKTMKKVHVPDTAAAGGSEVAIQVLAEKSNTGNEVITEAMAEVLIQQGKAGKAIELYQKLSLLNPAKSAYFAAKIENLKGQ